MTDILLGKGEQQIFLLAKYANRHGLVAGATGTGKTVSLLVIRGEDAHDAAAGESKGRCHVGRVNVTKGAQQDDMLHDRLWGTGRRQGMVEAMAKQAARTVGSELGRQILRGVLGGMSGRRT